MAVTVQHAHNTRHGAEQAALGLPFMRKGSGTLNVMTTSLPSRSAESCDRPGELLAESGGFEPPIEFLTL